MFIKVSVVSSLGTQLLYFEQWNTFLQKCAEKRRLYLEVGGKDMHSIQ